MNLSSSKVYAETENVEEPVENVQNEQFIRQGYVLKLYETYEDSTKPQTETIIQGEDLY